MGSALSNFKRQSKSMYSQFVAVPKFLLLFIMAVVCASCASLAGKPTVTTELNDERLRFSGKGAGAGVMLSSSMGPMGIAIGVAIDEGIAKAIRENAQANNLDIRFFVEQQFGAVAEELNVDLVVSIEGYGFKTTRSDTVKDPVRPYMTLTVLQQGHDEGVALRIPADNAEPCAECVFELEDMRSSGEALRSAFQIQARRMADQYIAMVVGAGG